MNNRIAFIDFVRGLLTINPLERWSPQQAKLHPFITQQKYTGQFVPPMNLKSSALNRSPAPGTQQQIQAEALSKQRAQAAQAQAQASTAAQGAYAPMVAGQYQQPGHAQQPSLYGNNNMYTPSSAHPGAPPPYSGGQQSAYGQMGGMSQQQAPVQMPPANYAQSNMYAAQQQQAGGRPRQRASTMEQQQSGIPAAIQRVASHLDPNQPIRLQPSPAYYPPPPEGLAGMDHQTSGRQPRRGSRAQQTGRGAGGGVGGGNMDFIRNLEERTLEEGFMGSGQSPWH
jgi:dual specificity protein kinase YAK1